MLKKILTSPWTALLTLVAIVAVVLQQPTFLESVKLRYFDTLITSKPVQTTNIVTVNIDEPTIDKYGQWPFGRDVYADIIKDLYARGAGLVVWNVMMPEQDRAGKDSVLAKTLSEYPVVLPSVGANDTKNKPRNPGAVMIGDPDGKVVEYPGILSSIESLESRAYGTGISSTFPEVDGVTRRMPLVIKSGDILYPSIGLEVLRILAGDPSFQIKFSDIGIDKLRVPQFGQIATDPIGRVWIDYQQRPTTYSLVELPNKFDNNIVIVGTSAAGIANPVATSRGELWPQEMQASVIATLASGTNIQRPDWAPGAELLALVALTFLLLFLTRWVYVGLGVGVVVLGSIVPLSMWAYSKYLYLFDGTLLLGGLTIILLHAYGVKFVSEFLQKQQIKKQFGSYVSPVIVERLQKNPDLIKLGGEEKMLTAVMTDMRNFTGLGEKYGADVEGFTAIMNAYMTAISKPVFANDGCLIKFIGDASLHIHGAPLDDDRHAYHAVKTTLEMIQAVEEFNKHLESIGKPPVGMGAGVNTGKILVGNIGSEGKMGYDVLGDPVSVASRLESQTKSYGVLMIIGPDTAEAVKDDFELVWLDNIAVKGKAVGLDIYTVGKTVHYKHEEFKKEYLRGDWTRARKWLRDLYNEDTDLQEYYTKMLARIDEGLPANWDGTYHATSK